MELTCLKLNKIAFSYYYWVFSGFYGWNVAEEWNFSLT